MSTEYSLSKIDIKPITGPWWTLTQFQKGFKSANKYLTPSNQSLERSLSQTKVSALSKTK